MLQQLQGYSSAHAKPQQGKVTVVVRVLHAYGVDDFDEIAGGEGKVFVPLGLAVEGKVNGEQGVFGWQMRLKELEGGGGFPVAMQAQQDVAAVAEPEVVDEGGFVGDGGHGGQK